MKDEAAPSVAHYTRVLLWLLALLGLTVGVAFLPLGPLATPVALLIAAAKGALVVIFFMHLGWSTGLIRLVAGVGLFWLGILFVLALNDFLTRR